MTKAVEAIVEELGKQAKEVGDSSEKIKQVAAISANNDETIGDLIATAFKKVGKMKVLLQLRRLKVQIHMLTL